MPDTPIYQAILDDHADEDLMSRLGRLADARCTGSVAVFDDEVLGVIFLVEGAVVDAIVIEGPWQGQGVQAVAFLANASGAQSLYQPTEHFGERTIEMGWKELDDRVALLRRLLPRLEPAAPVSASTAVDPRALHRPPSRAPLRRDRGHGRLTEDEFPAFGDVAGDATSTSTGAWQERYERFRTGSQQAADEADPCEPPQTPPAPLSPEKSLLDAIREVDGYQASAIMDRTGDLLWTDAPGAVDLPLLAGVFNDVFRATARVCHRYGLGPCASVVVHAQNAAVVMHCAGRAGDGPHLHAAAVLRPDGNQALMRLQLDRALPRVRAALV